MYTVANFKTKKALKEAVAERNVSVQSFTNGGPFEEKPGQGVIEMPHFPAPHTAYAAVEVQADEYGNLFIPKGSKVR